MHGFLTVLGRSVASVEVEGGLQFGGATFHVFGTSHLFTDDRYALVLDGAVDCLQDSDALVAQIGRKLLVSVHKSGFEAVRTLAGNFSALLFDKESQTLKAFCDPQGHNGILYYYDADCLKVFSSVHFYRSKLNDPNLKINDSKVQEYFTFRYVSGSETLYKGISQLLPGQELIFTSRGIDIRSRFDIRALFEGKGHKKGSISEKEIVLKFHSNLKNYVRLRQRQSGKIGMMLSGGLDSTYLLSLLDEKDLDNVKCLSLGFQGGSQDDIHNARKSAISKNVDFESILVDGRTYADSLPDVINRFGFPVDHPNFVARDILFNRAVRQGLTQLIAGEGADTLFGGSWYVGLKKLFWTKKVLPRILQGLCANRSGIAGKVYKALNTSIEDLIIFDKTYYGFDLLSEFVEFNLEPVVSFHRQQLARVSSKNYIDRALYLAHKTTLAVYPRDQIGLAKSSGAYLHYPFLEKNIIQMATQLPPSLIVNGFEGKYLLKKIARINLSKKIIDRPKCGLPVPLAAWFKDNRSLGRYFDYLLSADSCISPYVKLGSMLNLVERFHSGQDHLAELLWVFVNFEIWARQLNGEICG